MSVIRRARSGVRGSLLICGALLAVAVVGIGADEKQLSCDPLCKHSVAGPQNCAITFGACKVGIPIVDPLWGLTCCLAEGGTITPIEPTGSCTVTYNVNESYSRTLQPATMPGYQAKEIKLDCTVSKTCTLATISQTTCAGVVTTFRCSSTPQVTGAFQCHIDPC